MTSTAWLRRSGEGQELFDPARHLGRLTGRDARSVGQERHLEALGPPEEHGAGDGRRPEALAHVVERGVERAAGGPLEREGELDGVVVVEVGDGDADEA